MPDTITQVDLQADSEYCLDILLDYFEINYSLNPDDLIDTFSSSKYVRSWVQATSHSDVIVLEPIESTGEFRLQFVNDGKYAEFEDNHAFLDPTEEIFLNVFDISDLTYDVVADAIDQAVNWDRLIC